MELITRFWDSGVEAGLAGKEEALPTRLQKKMKVFMG